MLAPGGISEQPFFCVQGSAGELVIDGFSGGCHLHTASGEAGSPASRTLCHEGWDVGYRGEYADFAAAVLDGSSTLGGAEEAIADLRVVCAMMRATEADGWVEVQA